MTVEDFLDEFNNAPYGVSEVAGIASKIHDDNELSQCARALEKAETAFLQQLDRVGFEFG